MDADSIQIPHPTLGQVYLANQTYFPESFFTKSNIDSVVFLRSRQDFRRLSSVKYMDAKFVLQAISIPLKFRKGIDTIPYQTETGVNLGFGVAANYNPVSLERRASVYILQKNYQLALVDLKDAAKLNREYIYSIGYTYELMGELDSAILYYERYQSVSKTNVQSRIDSVRTKMSNN